MPRRRIFKEGSIKRDGLGRFAEKAGGRAPAIKRREGKNAKRREASARLLKASLARQRHEDFYEKNKHKELTPQRNKQLSNSVQGRKREEAKIDAAKIAIATERGRALKADRLPKVKPLTPLRPDRGAGTTAASIQDAVSREYGGKRKFTQTVHDLGDGKFGVQARNKRELEAAKAGLQKQGLSVTVKSGGLRDLVVGTPSHPGTTTIKSTREGREAARKERIKAKAAPVERMYKRSFDASDNGAGDVNHPEFQHRNRLRKRLNRLSATLEKKPQGKRENLTRKIVANQKANEKLNSSDERQRNIDENQRLRARALAKGGMTITVGQLKVGDELVEPRGAKITEVEDAGLAGVRYSHSKGGGGLSSPDQKIRVIPATRGTLPPLSKKERTSTIPYRPARRKRPRKR